MSDLFTNVKGKFNIQYKNRYLLFFSFFVDLMVLPYLFLFFSSSGRISTIEDLGAKKSDVAIVLGAGVDKDGNPSKYLKDRLDTGYELYESGKIKQIIVSGNNSDKANNEVDVMYNYLIDKGVPDYSLLKDPYGNRTYNSCARAKEVYGLDDVILVTQRFHLYRALELCNSLGVNSTGVSASEGIYYNGPIYLVRESLASSKALIDLYLITPDYSKEL